MDETTMWTQTVRYEFQDANAGGFQPTGGLIENASSALFGTMQKGGPTSTCAGGCGTVFEIEPVLRR